VHLVAGRPDIGDAIRQLRLGHRQWVEGLAEQFDFTGLCHEVPCEQLMEHSVGRGRARVYYILGERLVRRLDEDMDVVRCERKIRVEFEQLAKKRGDFTAARVAGFNSERAQEREFELPIIRKK
jgi:hypothetical protein